MPKNGACCLSSLNLSEFVVNPYTPDAYFDMNDFTKSVSIGVKALDTMIDENYKRHPLKEQQQMSYNYRNIGLGIFGYATTLYKLGFKYGDEKAIQFTDKIFYDMFRSAVIESNNLAKRFGSFPKYKQCVWESTIIKNHFTPKEIEEMKPYGLRNCSLISIAPNGSLATLLQESGGCEPEFALKYTRRTIGITDNEDKYYDVYCKGASEYMKVNNTSTLPDYFVCSSNIPWKDRVTTQGIMQNHVDTAISSTVNLPNSATKDDVANIYLQAWEQGLKGITIFRDGCKRQGILTTSKTNKKEDKSTDLSRGEWKPKAKDTTYYQRKLTIGCGKLMLFIGWSNSEQSIQDFYVTRSGQGGCERLLQSTVISMSAILRLGGDISNIEKAFRGIGGCNSFATQKGRGKELSKGNSCGVAIINEIKVFLNEKQGNEKNVKVQTNTKKEENTSKNTIETNKNMASKCPECGEYTLRQEGGCNSCVNCGKELPQ